MIALRIENLGKGFPDSSSNPVLDHVELTIKSTEIVAIRGDNGTGKTTLLNVIAGIYPPTRGTVDFPSFGRKPRIGYVPQDYTSSLLPWLDVLDNVSIPLRITGVPRYRRRQLARECLSELRFDLPQTAFPHQLSGGQRQRIAIARAIIHQPDILILDEPFANLDAHTARDLQETILNIHEEFRPTIILISHELDNCIYLGDRIVILGGRPGHIIREFKLDLPRPRQREIIFSKIFQDIRVGILKDEEILYAKRNL
jgi:NitT/TauT family transport system ATP-binding protein